MRHKKVLATLAVLGAVAATEVGAVVISAGDGHYYEFITDRKSWTDALADAGTRSFTTAGGVTLQGYLATVTSQQEQDFITNSVLPTNYDFFVYLGGSDDETYTGLAAGTGEGEWFWVTGPEAGTQFWTGGRFGSAVGGAYTNWNAGEPNNEVIAGSKPFGEDYLDLLNAASGFRWNDSDNLSTSKGPLPYVVEYGGFSAQPAPIPEPGTMLLLGSGLLGLAGYGRKRKK